MMIEEQFEFIKANWRYLAIGLAVMLVCGGGYLWYHNQQNAQQSKLIAAAATSRHETVKASSHVTTAKSEQAYVYVAGAVRHPGLYLIRRQMRWADVVQSAGGLSKDADVSGINLAKIAKDQENLTVPTKGASSAAPPAGSSAAAATTAATSSGGAVNASSAAATIDLNSATTEQLQTISGVGPKRAQDIIDYRNQHGGFKKVDELKDISGIGDKIFADIAPKVMVGP
jgi:competence protein ComEA